LEDLDQELPETELRYFVRSSFNIIEFNKEFQPNWHIEFLCEHLELVFENQIQTLVINIPPGRMKTTMCTVAFPPWCWIKKPELRFIMSSYSGDLSTIYNVRRRDIIRSDWYQKRWGKNYQIKDDEDLKTFFKNDKTGYMVATSTGGTTGGKHADITIADDPLNPEEAESDVKRERANDHVKYLYTTRRRDPKTSKFILIMQRLHVNDPVAAIEEILETDRRNFTHVVLPEISPKKTVLKYPKSGKKKVRKEGHYLWKSRFGKRENEQAKIALGEYGYSGQYDQEPVPRKGGIITREDLMRYGVLPQTNFSVLSFDTATKDKEINDPTGVCRIEEGENGYYITNAFEEHVKALDLEDFIADTFSDNPTNVVLIEDKSSGMRAVQHFRKKMKLPVQGFKPTPFGDKVSRLSRIAPYARAGKIWVPEEADWLFKFIQQLIKFPKAKRDDMVDAFSQAMIYLTELKNVGKFTVPKNFSPNPGMRKGPRMPSRGFKDTW